MVLVKSLFSAVFWGLALIIGAAPCLAQGRHADREIPWDGSPLAKETLTLDHAITMAMKNNPEMKVADARLDLARADLAEEEARLLPSIQGRLFQALETLHHENISDTGVLLEQPLYRGGKLVAGKKIAQANLGLREAGLERAYQNTSLAVTRAYYAVVSAQLLVAALEGSLTRITEHLRGLQLRLERDMIPQVEVLKVRTHMARTQSALLEAQSDLQYARGYLNTLIGRDERDIPQLPEIAGYVPLALTLTECYAMADEHHPEYKQAALKITSDKEAVGVAAGDMLPQIQFFTDFDKREDVFINRTELKVGVSGSWNVWDWGRTARTVDQFRAAMRESEADQEALRRDTRLAIRRAYFSILTNQQQIDLAVQVIKTATVEFQNQLLRYKHGQTTNTEVLDAQEALTKSEIAYAESLGGSYAARALLANHLGVRDIAAWERRAQQLSDEELLDLLERKSFLFFQEAQDAQTGLFRDASGGGDSSIAACGFGLTALCVGASRGWIGEKAAREMALRGIRAFLPVAEGGTGLAEGKWGFFFHFLDPATGRRAHDSELSTVDTAILLAGAITAGEYFGGEIWDLAQKLYARIEWNRFLGAEGSPRAGFIGMGWHPRTGFLDAWWDTYTDETMLVDLLAIGSPTHPVPPDVFYAWKREKGSYADGPAFVCSYQGGLFTYQYAHLWFDLRGRKDAQGIDWVQNSAEATRTGIRFCTDLSGKYKGFGPDAWGITSYHTQKGYVMHHGFAPALSGMPVFDGTISPSGPAGSLPFTPAESLAALRNFYLHHPMLWGPYGFRDSYNAGIAWTSPLNFALGTGLTLIAIENHRTGLVWKTFMKNPQVQRALDMARVK